MIFELTAEQQKELDKLNKQINTALHSENSTPAAGELLAQRDDFLFGCEKAAFHAIATDPAAIINHAKEQAPQILNNRFLELSSMCDEQKNIDFLISKGFILKFQDRFLMTFNYAKSEINEELFFHFDTLFDTPNYEKLKRDIFDIIQDLPYIQPGEYDGFILDPEKVARLQIDYQGDRIATKAIDFDYMPMYHGKATDALARLSHRDLKLQSHNRASVQAVFV